MSSGWGLFTMRKECERKWTQSKEQPRKNLKYLLFMRHERKRRKACQIFCAAVAQRYLLVHARITFASGKISPPKGRHGFTSKIQNGKSTTSARDMEARFRRAHQREAVPQRPPESTDRKKWHVPQVRQWGRRLGTEMFDSYEAFMPLSPAPWWRREYPP